MSTCNAPCIINTGSGFHLIFCDQDLSHTGDHARYIAYAPSNPIIRWRYTGEAADLPQRPPEALLLRARCKATTFVPDLLHIEPIPDGLQQLCRTPPLFAIVKHADHNGGFSCKMRLNHTGFHTRHGEFKPLGITWNITWS